MNDYFNKIQSDFDLIENIGPLRKWTSSQIGAKIIHSVCSTGSVRWKKLIKTIRIYLPQTDRDIACGVTRINCYFVPRFHIGMKLR